MARRYGAARKGPRVAGWIPIAVALLALAAPTTAAPGGPPTVPATAPAVAGTCTSGATLSASPASGAVPVIVDFLTTLPSSPVAPTYAWVFGDGVDWNGSGGGYAAPAHLYTRSGQYNATVSMAEGSAEFSCSVGLDLASSGPIVAASASATRGTAPLTVRFDGSASGGSGTYVQIRWSFGDGTVASGLSANHTFQSDGTYEVQFEVVDSNGSNGLATLQIEVGAPGALAWTLDLLGGLVAALAIGLAVALFRLSRARRARSAEGPDRTLPGPSGGPPAVRATSGTAPIVAAPPSVSPTPTPGPPLRADPPAGEMLRVSERIVRHLAAQGFLRSDEVASTAFTQEGIQQAIGVSRSSVSNALRRLERAGVLSSDVRHVRGGRRRLRVYALTDRGRALADEMRGGRR